MKKDELGAGIDQLQRLYSLREKRALEALAEQRKETESVIVRRNEQIKLIQALRDELKGLHLLRSNQHILSMSANSLILESERRQCLTHDLEKEEFYLPGFLRDVEDAQRELARRKHIWQRAQERIKALGVKSHNQRSQDRRKLQRGEELEIAYTQAIKVNSHG